MSLAELFGMKETWRQRMTRARRDWLRTRHSKPQHSAPSTRHFTLESLEPRLLLSGTTLTPDQLALDGAAIGQAATGDPAPLVLLDDGSQTGSGTLATTADIQPQAPPAEPTAVAAADRANDAGGAITLTWTPSVSGGVTEQRIYRSSPVAGETVQLVATIQGNTSASYTDTGRIDGTPYVYAITAFSADGESIPSSPEVTATSSSQVTKTWVGATTGDWVTGSNWSGGTTPGASDIVSIGSGVTVTHSVGTDTVVGMFGAGSLTVSGGTLTTSSLSEMNGTLTISGGTVTANGALTVTSLALSAGTLTGTGTVTVSGATTWTWGTMTGTGVTNTVGGLTLSGGSAKELSGGRTLNTPGTTHWTNTGPANGQIQVGGGAIINNSGTWLDENASFTSIQSLGGAVTFNNSGTYTKSGAFNTTIGSLFNNTGIVTVSAGTLTMTGGGTSTGSFTGAAGTTLVFQGVTATLLTAASSITGAGSVAVALDGSAVTLTIDGTYNLTGLTSATTLSQGIMNFGVGATLTSLGAVTITSGTADFGGHNVTLPTLTQSFGTLTGTGIVTVSGATTWTGGTQTGTGVTNTVGGLTLSGGSAKELSGGRTLSTPGTTHWTNTGPANGQIQVGGGAIINNSGTWLDENAFSTSIQFIGGAASTFNNSGTYTKSGADTTTINSLFNNSGAVEVQSGTLSFTGGFTQTAGLTKLNGGNLSVSGTLGLNGGTLSGTGTVTATTVSNTGGQVGPGLSPGTLTIAGNYTQGAGGTLNIEIGGTTVDTQYDRLAISGLATLGGTLNASLINSFAPASGNAFGVMTFGSSTGDFTTKNVPGISGLAFQATPSGTAYTLDVLPAAPTSLTATDQPNDTGGTIVLTWTPSTATNITQQRIYRSTTPGSGYTLIPPPIINNTTATYTDSTGLTNGTTYYYVVRAFDGAIESGNSNETSAAPVRNIVTWVGGVSNLWQDAGNWAGGVLPGAAQAVQIGAGFNITLSSGGHTIASLQSDSPITVSGGSLTISNTSAINHTLTISGGTVTANGALTVTSLSFSSGTLNGTGSVTLTGSGSSWTGGTMSGTGTTQVASGGTLTVSGTGAKFLQRNLTNTGTVALATGMTNFTMGGTGVGIIALTNQVGGVVDLQGAVTIAANTGTLSLVNEGLLTKSGGVGTTGAINVAVSNSGTVEVQTGTLDFNSTVSNSGTMRVFAGATLPIDTAWTHQTGGVFVTDPASGPTPAGSIQLTTGTLTLNADLTAPTNFTMSGGTLTGSGAFIIPTGATTTWTGGTMSVGTGTTQVASGGTLTVSGAGSKFLQRNLTNTGTMALATGMTNFTMGGTGVGIIALTNQVGGVVDLQGAVTIAINTGTLSLVNEGLLTKSGGAGTTGAINVAVSNSGTVEVQTGTLDFNSTVSNSGTMRVFAGATLPIDTAWTHQTGGVFVTDPASGPTPAGSIQLTTGTLTLNADLTAPTNFTMSGGTLTGSGAFIIPTGATTTWTGGTMSVGTGTTQVASGGTLTVSGAGSKFLQRNLTNTGTMALATGMTNFTMGGTGVGIIALTNQVGGVVDLQGAVTIAINTGTLSLVNEGLLTKSGGAGTTGAINVAVSNSGTVEVQSGTLTLSGAVTNSGTLNPTGGILSLTGGGSGDGTFKATSTGTLRFAASYTFTNASTTRFEGTGTIDFLSGTFTVPSLSTYDVSGITQVSGATVTLSGTVTNIGNVIVSGGTMTLNSAAPATSLNQSAGTLGGTGNLTVSGATSWTGGTMSGTGTTQAQGGLTLSGAGAKNLGGGRVLEHVGTGSWTGTGPLQSTASGLGILRLVSGTFTVGDAGAQNTGNGGGTLALEIQAGATLEKILGGTTSFNFGVASVTNDGTVDVQGGTLALAGSGTSTHTSAFTVASGSTLDFVGGTHTLTAASSISGAGTGDFSSGTVQIGGTYNVTGATTVTGGTANFTGTLTSLGPTLAISSGTANLSSGEALALTTLTLSGGILAGTDVLTVSGATSWTSGTMTGTGLTQAQGGLTLSGAGAKNLGGGRVLEHVGTGSWTGTGPLQSTASGLGILRLVSGTFTVGDAGAQNTGNGGGTLALEIQAGATLEKILGGTTSFNFGVASVTNDGTVDVQGGTLALAGSGTSTHTSAFTVASGSTLDFVGGTHTLTAASSISGAGTGDFSSGTVQIGGTYNVTGATTVTGGTANFTGTLTSLGSTLAISSGTANLSSGEALALTTLTLSGGILAGTDVLTVSGATSWTSGTMTGTGLTQAQGGLTLSGAGAKNLGGGRVLEHVGTGSWTGTGPLQSIASGLGILRLVSGTFTVGDAGAQNTGNGGGTLALEIQAGATLEKILGGTTSFNFGVASVTNAGTVDITSGTLSIGSSGYQQTSGLTSLTGGSLTVAGTLTLSGGSLTGTGTVTAATVSNTGGQVGPGLSPGTLTITGAYTQGASGTLNIEVGGTTVGTQYDRLAISGLATLNGTLNVTLINGFTPTLGNSFQFMSFGSRSGDFTTKTIAPQLQADAPGATAYTLSTSVLPNNAPAGTDKTITINEDTPYSFTLADFGFTDPLDSPANNFQAVKITTLPGSGTLTLNGTSVNVGDSIAIPPAGVSWTARASFEFWRGVASSADGTKLVAVADSQQLYTSTDAGVTWTARESIRSWYGVASSADGTRLVASVNGGQLYTSTDAGVTWTVRESIRSWYGVASSADGTRLVAATANGGQLYTSTDAGVSWTARESNRIWVSVASSADGTQLVAGDYGGRLYTSTDAGVSWTARESNRQWWSVASSADGTQLIAGDYGGQLYTSTDAGVTWTARESSRGWYAVASSADGTKLVAAEQFGQLYTSTDAGVTWTARESIRSWYAVASSADGTQLVAGVYSGQLYTSVSQPGLVFSPAANANGAAYASLTFQVQDNGGTANTGVDLDPTPNTITINVTPVNDAPAMTAGGTLGYTENQAATALDPTITVSDVDNATLASATVQLDNYQPGADVLGVINVPATMGNITGSFNATTGELVLSSADATATLAQWQAALRAVTYVNSSANPSPLARTNYWSVSDGNLSSTVVTSTITVTPVNNPPVGVTDTYAVQPGATLRAGAGLVKDIIPGDSTSLPQELTNVDGTLFFSASDGINGFGLWKSDGTAAGTVLVKDISPVSPLQAITNVNGTLFFTADDGVNGFELWKSDRTAAGTVLLKDINPILGDGSNPQSLTNVNGTLFFQATSNIAIGSELWKSDGTTAGTVLVKNIASAENASSHPANLTDVDGTLFFTAISSSGTGVELWKSDGTEAGTELVQDIWAGGNSANPSALTNVNGTLFFTADDGVNGFELWKSDGMAAGTVLVKDINPISFSPSPQALTNVNGTLFFTADDGVSGFELWKSNGMAVGTVLVKDINPVNFSPPQALTNVNGTLFFQASDEVKGGELWRSDGTAEGTVLVKDINPISFSPSLQALTNVDGTLFFTADDGINGFELWKSDGTAEGTVLVKDINPGVGVSFPQELTNVNGTLFFSADDGVHSLELWKSETALSPLANDTDPDSPTLTATLVTGPTHGTLTLNTDGSFTYQPTAGFIGTDFFTYQASDGALTSAPTTVTLNVGIIATYLVTSTADSGAGSLRQAIIDANTSAGLDAINFNISGAGVHTIAPLTALPNITDAVIIDGYTQPGSSFNELLVGNDAVLRIELDGSNVLANSGLFITAGNSTVRGLVINRFGIQGITLESGGNNIIEGNFIGTDPTGTIDRGNLLEGILIWSGSANNRIGGTTPAARNLLSGNDLSGIQIQNNTTGVTGNLVQGNYIGTNASGTTALSNGTSGILVNASPTNTIGGTAAGARNLISGNLESGALIFGAGATGNVIQGNFIGTNAAGTAALGNQGSGVFVLSANNQIGGSNPSARNVIAGNGTPGSPDLANGDGVVILQSGGTGNVVAGNFIGTDVSGLIALGNTKSGVAIYDSASSNTIGGSVVGAGNLISGNLGHGVDIAFGSTANLVLGNAIGPNVSGTATLGNAGAGVLINFSSINNRVGGVLPGDANRITGSGDSGVKVDIGSTGTSILGNAIFANTRLGIDLAAAGDPPNGVTPNDPLDADIGPNNLQNFPVLTSAFVGNPFISGTLNSQSNQTYTIEFFSNPAGTTQGQTFLGRTAVVTDSSGNASFTIQLSATVSAGQVVTATATDANGNTSEFSVGVTVTNAGVGQVPLSVRINGTGSGRVTSLPLGIDLITGAPSDSTELLPTGTLVTLTATADAPGSTFAGWSGFGFSSLVATVTVPVTVARTYTATFVPTNSAELLPVVPAFAEAESIWPGTITFAWQPVVPAAGQVLAGYNLYVGFAPGQYGDPIFVQPGTTALTLFNVPHVPHYFAVTALVVPPGPLGTPSDPLNPSAAGFEPLSGAPPSANPETYATAKNLQFITVKATGVLANETDPENDVLTAVLVGPGPGNGQLIGPLNPDGSFIYKPNNNFTGTDSFTYQISDGTPANVRTATATIVIAQESGFSSEGAATPTEGLEAWTVVDQGTVQGPSNWTSVQSPIFGQLTGIGAPANPTDLAKLGTVLFRTEGLVQGRSDFSLSFNLRSEGSGAVGVVFRYTDANNYYRFAMDDAGGYRRLIRMQGGVATTLLEQSNLPDVYTPGLQYPLTVEAIGNQLRVTLRNPITGLLLVNWTVPESSANVLGGSGFGLYSANNAGSYYTLLGNTYSGAPPSTVAALEVRTTNVGTVSSLPAGITLPGSPVNSYPLTAGNPTIQLTATPAPGTTFQGWTTESGAPITAGGQLTLNQNTIVRATFSLPRPALSLDIDGNGQTTGAQDGIMLFRYLFGATDPAAITAQALSPNATRTPAEILAYLNQARSTMLDVDGNGTATGAQDGIMLFRYLFGATDPAAITAQAIAPNALRTAGQIFAWLQLYDSDVAVLSAATASSSLDVMHGALVPLTLPSELVPEHRLPNGPKPTSPIGTGPADLLTDVTEFRNDPRFKRIDGRGMTAVVIDTGIDVDHPFFGPDRDQNGIADRIIYQWDFADGDPDASDRNGHGSHVASLIASEDPTLPGVAPRANLIALKVFQDNGIGNFGYLEQALQWVVAHADDYGGIDVVNLSLGDGGNLAGPAALYGVSDEFAALDAQGIIMVAAAGNNYFRFNGQQGLAYPAADPHVLAVGSVWSSDFGGPFNFSSGASDLTTGPDRISSFSQRSGADLDVFAPGARLTGANHLGGTLVLQGTSQAAAYLSGTTLLAQQLAQRELHRTLTRQELTELYRETGRLIVDGDDEVDNVLNTGLTFPRVDMLALGEEIRAMRPDRGHHHGPHRHDRLLDLSIAAAQWAQRVQSPRWVADFVGKGPAEAEDELVIRL